MADQQDQSSSGGSVEKTSASADTSKLRGKSSSSGSSGYRKRHNSGAIPVTLEEKRRKQTIGESQSLQFLPVASSSSSPLQRRSVDSAKGENRPRGERKGHGTGLGLLLGKEKLGSTRNDRLLLNKESPNEYIILIFIIFLDTDWRQRQKSQHLNTGGNIVRIRNSAIKSSSSDLNLAVDCVASRTRSRAPTSTSFSSRPITELPVPSSFSNRKITPTNNNLIPSTSTTSNPNHPSTSKGRG